MKYFVNSLSQMLCIVVVLLATKRESRDTGGLVISGDFRSSSRNELVSVEWSRQKERSVGGRRGVGSVERLVK